MAEPIENYEKVLNTNLARVIDWLKFSETKNGVLLALASAWTVAATNVAVRTDGIPAGYERALPLSITIFLLAILRLIWSFMPEISLPKFLSRSTGPFRDANLIFYGDIAKVEITEIGRELEERYLPTGRTPIGLSTSQIWPSRYASSAASRTKSSRHSGLRAGSASWA